MATTGSGIKVGDAVRIGRSLYCTTPGSVADARHRLAELGYEITNERTDGYAVREGRATPEELEKGVRPLWHASLPDLRRAKCGCCGEYNSMAGTLMHGRACEHCGDVIYRHIVDGSEVRFRFTEPDGRGLFPGKLQMTAQRWDADKGFLYLKPEFLDRSWGAVTGTAAELYMADHAGKWELVEEGHGRSARYLYKIRYSRSIRRQDDDAIDMLEVSGHERRYKVVRIWNGREYPEYDFSGALPVPESLEIYETWHWAPLGASPDLHKTLLHVIGNHDDKGWHYQDGSPWFTKRSWEQIGLFVRHFTTLDADEWDRQSRGFPLDGPGGIDAVAAFCHPLAAPENRPNVGNLLSALGNVIEGLPVTRAEDDAALEAIVFDEQAGEFLTHLAARRNRRPLRRRHSGGPPGGGM